MASSDRFSRVEKFEKRRRNTKAITILMVIGSMLSMILIYMFIFGSSSEETSNESDHTEGNQNENDNSIEVDTSTNLDEETNQQEESTDESTTNENNDSNENNDLLETNEIKQNIVESEDDNVVEAYEANWPPIGTSQTEPHTIQYKKDTVDWEEMEEAIASAIPLQRSEMVTYWIGNGGELKAVGTVYNKNNKDEIYRVTIEWEQYEGYKPIKVERLKELAK